MKNTFARNTCRSRDVIRKCLGDLTRLTPQNSHTPRYTNSKNCCTLSDNFEFRTINVFQGAYVMTKRKSSRIIRHFVKPTRNMRNKTKNQVVHKLNGLQPCSYSVFMFLNETYVTCRLISMMCCLESAVQTVSQARKAHSRTSWKSKLPQNDLQLVRKAHPF